MSQGKWGENKGEDLGGAEFRLAVKLDGGFRWPAQIHSASSPHLIRRQILGLNETTLVAGMIGFLKQISE